MFLICECFIVCKVKEVIMVVIIDVCYSKLEIIEVYLNEVFLG